MATSVRRSVLVVLAFVASLVFTAFTAPASLAAGEVAASWGTDCATIEVSSSGWPADDFVHVRWYATADSATPGVDGEAWWPVNQAWTRAVDPSKVRGFSYRIVSPDGSGGWTDVTPLKDQAASCVVVLQPYVTSGSTCDAVVVAARNFGTTFPYVITTKVNGVVADQRTVTGDAAFTVPFPFTGGSWTVDTKWRDDPTAASGIHHSEGTSLGCDYIPPVEKVGLDGKRIQGASWAFEYCAKYNDEPDWICTPTFNPADKIGWSDYIRRNVDSEAFASQVRNENLPPTEEITIWETAAPAGYSVNPERVTITFVCGGWHLGDRTTASCSTPLYGFDQAAYEAAGRTMATQKPVRLTNARDLPVIHSTSPALAKVDGEGKTVVGARVIGWACNRWDNSVEWQCQNLADYTIDPSDAGFLQREIAVTLPDGTTTSAYRPVENRIVIWESSAPEGYTLSSRMYAVDYACGAWRTITVTEKTEAAAKNAPLATCDSPILANNTFRWVNVKRSHPSHPSHPTPEMPETPSSPDHPATTPGALPATGSNAQDIAPVAVALLVLGTSLLAASRLTLTLRRSRTRR